MANKELLEYLKKGLKRGFPLEELKQNLLSRGFFDYDINEAIDQLNSQKDEIDKPEKKLSFFSPKFILYSVVGFFIFLVLVIFYVFNSQSSTILNDDLSEGLSVDMMQNKIEFDLDDGVSVNYAKFEGAVAKI